MSRILGLDRKTSTVVFGSVTTALVGAALTGLSFAAQAQTPAPPAAVAPAAPAAPAAPPAPSTTGMAGPLAANANPSLIDAGPLGSVYVTGALTGLVQLQDNRSLTDRDIQADVSSAQVFINKTSGPIQFFLQGGAYSLPDIGTPYLRSKVATNAYYGTLPQAFIKYVPNSTFSIEAGKLPTLIGAEYTWSFENMNVERGLLWNQENAVNRGIQANYVKGPLSLAASWNDGLYSNIYSWLWLSATQTVNKTDTLAFIAGGNTKRTVENTLATPGFLNNEQIYNLIYTHVTGPWTIQPYFQYTTVPKLPALGTTASASTTGAALLVNYAFPATAKMGGMSLSGVNLPVRLEYISSTGSVANGAPNLLYGQGSNAFSLTVTPTYQYKTFFSRMEVSYVNAGKITAGDAFGASGNDKSQSRFLIESGILF